MAYQFFFPLDLQLHESIPGTLPGTGYKLSPQAIPPGSRFYQTWVLREERSFLPSTKHIGVGCWLHDTKEEDSSSCQWCILKPAKIRFSFLSSTSFTQIITVYFSTFDAGLVNGFTKVNRIYSVDLYDTTMDYQDIHISDELIKSQLIWPDMSLSDTKDAKDQEKYVKHKVQHIISNGQLNKINVLLKKLYRAHSCFFFGGKFCQSLMYKSASFLIDKSMHY